MQKWTDLLPELWNEDPEVIIVMVPADPGCLHVMRSPDNEDTMRVLVCELSDGRRLGLQVMQPELDTYAEHNQFFREHLGGRMAHPAHFGKLSKVPARFLTSADFRPLVFNKDHMSHKPLDLLAAIESITPDHRSK